MASNKSKCSPSADDGCPQTQIDQLVTKLEALEQQKRTLRRQLEALRGERLSDKPPEPDGAQALQLAELIIENSPAILFRRLAADDLDDRRMVYVSPNIARFGYRAEDFLSGRMMYRDIVYPGDFPTLQKEIQSYVDQGIETYTQIYRIVTREGDIRWVEDRTSVVADPATGTRYHQGIVIDIHRRKEAEEKLRRSEEKYRRIVETAGEGFLLMDDALKVVDLNAAFAEMIGRSREALIGKRLFQTTSFEYEKFRSTSCRDLMDDSYHAFEGEVQASDGRSIPVLFHANPLQSKTGACIGTMTFVTDMTEHKKALTLAAEVQRSLLPETAPAVSGLDIAGRNVPCDEIGGDYFDFLWDVRTGDGPISVVVGDISGHGVDSALLMSSARAFLRMRASQAGTMAEVVTAMNGHLTEDVDTTGRFMTLFYLNIDSNRRGVEWIRAGHDPALVYDPVQDHFHALSGPGLALGVDRDYAYQTQSFTGLEVGQIIALGTDGIWEGCNTHGAMFGKDRFMEIIRRNATADADTILNEVFEEHSRFSQGVRREDDITLVVVKVVR